MDDERRREGAISVSLVLVILRPVENDDRRRTNDRDPSTDGMGRRWRKRGERERERGVIIEMGRCVIVTANFY